MRNTTGKLTLINKQRNHNMKTFARIILTFFTVVASYFFIYWVPFSLIPGAHNIKFIPIVVSLLISFTIGYFVWKKMGSISNSLAKYIFMGNNYWFNWFYFRLFWTNYSNSVFQPRTIARYFLYWTVRISDWINCRWNLLASRSEKQTSMNLLRITQCIFHSWVGAYFNRGFPHPFSVMPDGKSLRNPLRNMHKPLHTLIS